MTDKKISKKALKEALERAKKAIEENKVLKEEYAISSSAEGSNDFLIKRPNKSLTRVVRGSKGKKGEIGEVGSTGREGDRGLKGIKGDQGVKGVSGIRGVTGHIGKQGERGEQGPPSNRIGSIALIIGPQGERGEQGSPGSIGAKGDKGIQGEVGSIGKTGERGAAGVQGLQGEQGDTGKKGIVGTKGAKGEHGIPGIVGTKGEIGDIPKHEWEDTRLRFQIPGNDRFGNDIWGRWVELGVSDDSFLGKSGLIVNPAFDLTIKANGSQVGSSDINTLDFSSDFTITESPDKEINISVVGGGSGSLTTIKEATVQVGGADIKILDFGAGFDLSESPDKEINITLDLSEISAGGELAGTMDAPTIDTIHSGSAHHTKYTDTEAIVAVEGESTLDLTGNVTIVGTLLVDVINEKDSNDGVTIEGVLLQDSFIAASAVPDGADATAIHVFDGYISFGSEPVSGQTVTV